MSNKLGFLTGKDSKLNGLLSFLVIFAMVLGCTCNKDFSLDDKGDDSRTQQDKPSSTNKRQPKPRIDIPADDTGFDVLNRDVATALVKNTFADFTEGVESNDFSTLHENSCEELKESFTPKKLSESFKSYVDRRDRIAPILRQIDNLTPTINQPEVTIKGETKSIQLKGTFQTTPTVTSFNFEYFLEDGYWRAFGINVKIGK